MQISFRATGKSYSVDSASGCCIAIPLIFNGAQPNSYDVPQAAAEAYEADGFIGDTRRGGGCNFETYTLTPHCNGTHTECVGHITHDRIAVSEILKNAFFPATLITVTPGPVDGEESYIQDFGEGDRVITKKILEKAIGFFSSGPRAAGFLEALIIRTLPNDDSKKSRRYMKSVPPFFSNEAMHYLVSLNVRHLLVDLPSLDRTFDEGKLSNHHIFFGPEQPSPKTVTEMIYVPEEVSDGSYLLNLQIPAFVSDAAPSRPIIFPLHT